MRFSGHESFACRYAWLPKAYRALKVDSSALVNDEQSMVKLGVGKNMVNSIRFWIEVMGVATPRGQRVFEPTVFGERVFSDEGFDPFLEDTRTLWLLHWHMSSRRTDPIFAWNFLLNHWPYPEFTRHEALLAFKREGEKLGYAHSLATLGQHLDVFLHTYVPSRAKTAVEESLDGPLVELALLEQAGQRRAGLIGPAEPVYVFRREAKPEITKEVFEYCLNNYWSQWHGAEKTLTFRDIAVTECSIGQVFKLPEDDLRARLEAYASPTPELRFEYRPSAVQGLVTRSHSDEYDFLSAVYEAS